MARVTMVPAGAVLTQNSIVLLPEQYEALQDKIGDQARAIAEARVGSRMMSTELRRHKELLAKETQRAIREMTHCQQVVQEAAASANERDDLRLRLGVEVQKRQALYELVEEIVTDDRVPEDDDGCWCLYCGWEGANNAKPVHGIDCWLARAKTLLENQKREVEQHAQS